MDVNGHKSHCNWLLIVMCGPWLGLKALALAWLEAAQAWQNHKLGQKPKIGLRLARLRPRPGPASATTSCTTTSVHHDYEVAREVMFFFRVSFSYSNTYFSYYYLHYAYHNH